MVARLGNMSSLRDFITFVATVRGDISHITAPPFLLAPQSLTEFPSYWAERPAVFAAPGLESDPERRMLLVVKLYLASLQRQYYVGRPVKEGLKKPLNPYLGELFFGEWSDESANATVKVVSEQVCHHPPTTACYLADDENGVFAQAYSTQFTTLSGTSIVIRQSGHALLSIPKYNETYLLPLPDVHARSVLSGCPWPELNGAYRIVSSSGFVAEIHFAGTQKWFWQTKPERNTFMASIFRSSTSSSSPTDETTPIFTVKGSWSSEFTFEDASGETVETFNLSEPSNTPVTPNILPLSSQNPWESRVGWDGLFTAINTGDVSNIVREKSRVEMAQREMRAREKSQGIKEKDWEVAFFERIDGHVENDTFEELLDTTLSRATTNDEGKRKREEQRWRGTNGRWRFVKSRYDKWMNDTVGGFGKPRNKIRIPGRPETPFG